MDSLNPYNPFENRKRGTPYTREQLDYILQLLDQGWSLSKICKEYNLSIDSLRKRQKSNNWQIKQHVRVHPLTEEELNEIKRLVRNNVDLKIISEQFQISVSALEKRIVNNHWDKKRKKNKYSFDENYFDNITTEHQAYWLGFLYADGYILSKRKRVNINENQSFGFAISMKDKELFGYFKSDLKAENPVNVYQPGNNGFDNGHSYGRILLTSQHTVDSLKSWGCVENKTLILKFPNIPKELIPHFIRGYSDGDGSIVKDKNNRCSWNFCGTKELLNSIQEYFGFNYKLVQRFPERHNNNYCLRITGPNSLKALNICYKDATVFLKRKYDKYVEIQGRYKNV